MISVNEAKEILFNNLPLSVPETVSIEKSAGFVLAEDLVSPMDVPQFDNSAMDGYAFCYEDYQNGKAIKPTHTVQAGITKTPIIHAGEAARIFTGAPIPEGLDTVAMQETVKLEDGFLKFSDHISKGDHIRKTASQTAKGEMVGKKGMLINPGLIGFLAGLGISRVKIYRAPTVTILSSGKELVPPGNPLNFGQIYESSSYALQAALGELQIQATKLPIVEDKRELMFDAIEKALRNTDILLITGGISVGDYDFVQSILEELGVGKLFYKIRQKPGKPLFAGKRGNQLVFGLPGNPASTLTCFYQYVRPAALMMMGKKEYPQTPQMLRLNNSCQKKEGLTQFMKGLAHGDEVRVLSDQESYKMNSFAQSNCLVELEEGKGLFQKGDLVKVHFLR